MNIVITGATAGIGRAAALELASRGAQLILLNRNAEKARELADEITTTGASAPHLITMDMARLESVREAARLVLALGVEIDVLLNNAGLVNNERRVTVDGFEETIAVNHLAPFLLTGLLIPALSGNARVVNVSSEAHAMVKGMGFEDMHAEQSYRTFREYGRSKLANVLFTRSLAQRLKGTNITVNALHPGAVSTGLGTQNGGLFSKILPVLLKPFFRSAEDGAATSLYLCTSPDVAGVSGRYFANCAEKQPRRWALDDDAAERLWRFSEDAVAFKYPDLVGAST